ncbi:MAG: sialate O-acetylesterase [Bacteroidota bacterium]
MRSNLVHIALCLFVMIGESQADVRLPAVFGSNMVLQRNSPIPVWGSASPGESIHVVLDGQEKVSTADPVGNWLVTLDPVAGGGPFEMVIRGRNSITLKNILIGEVWICSGQSNMSFELKKATDAENVLPKVSNPNIRLFNAKRVLSDVPLKEGKRKWEECTPTSAEKFSAVAYFFGKNLYDSIHVPIGLIHVSWGGTAAEGWMPREVLERDSEFLPIIQRWIDDSIHYPFALKEFNESLPAATAKWNSDSVTAVALGRALPRKPTAPRGPGHRDMPCGQFNGMLNPIIPFAMRGVIWYQGEANASRGYQYRKLFPALIASWRSLWGEGDFPFYYVQLPNLDRQPEPSKSGWAEVRESQLMTLSVPNTGMAVTIDVGDPANLHPTNKKPVGERLALIALAKTYHYSLEYSGPLYESAVADGNRMRIRFSHAGGGFTVTGNSTIKGFTIAGADRKFYPAKADLHDAEIVVFSPQVPVPVSVRYGWADNPSCNLYNAAGLPASPFRMDDWPEVTFRKR